MLCYITSRTIVIAREISNAGPHASGTIDAGSGNWVDLAAEGCTCVQTEEIKRYRMKDLSMSE